VKNKARSCWFWVRGGRTLIPLSKKGFKIIGIDIVSAMVEASKKRVGNLPIEVYEMDASNLKFNSNSFDYVFFPFHGIDNVYPDIYKCVREVARVLKPSGVFIFNSHNRLFLKVLHRVFEGRYARYGEYIQFRITPFEYFGLKKYFKKVKSNREYQCFRGVELIGRIFVINCCRYLIGLHILFVLTLTSNYDLKKKTLWFKTIYYVLEDMPNIEVLKKKYSRLMF